MTTAPTLETGRLRLRRFETADFEAFAAFFADAEASAFVGGPLAPDAAWMRFCAEIGHWSAAGYGVWAVETRGDAAFVGGTGFRRLEGWGVVELTWFVAPAQRRRGFALEASRAAIGHANDVWGWRAVETVARDENAAARALIARLGGVVARRATFPDGIARDVFRLSPQDHDRSAAGGRA